MNFRDVLTGRAGWEGIRSLLLSANAGEVLADQLKALLPAGAAVGPCRPTEVRFKPDREITAYCNAPVSLESSKQACVRPIAMRWGPQTNSGRPEESVDVAEIQAEARRRGVAAPFLELTADSPAQSMRVWVSPLDTRFSQLVRLLDPQYVRAMLARAGVRASGPGGSGEYSPNSLKYRPGKSHVLRYDPLDSGAEAIFAKLYIVQERARTFRREDAARAFQMANLAADWLDQHGGNASCLRPLACIAEDAVVLYPQAVGTPLSDCAAHFPDQVPTWLQSAGAALRTLHQMPLASAVLLGPQHDLAAEVRLIAKKSGYIPALLPRLGSAITAVLDRAQELHARLPQEPPSFTHGDLKSEHIWIRGGQLTLMDFDTCRLADPALDVGTFLADWHFLNAPRSQARFEEMRSSFIAGYGPGVPKERLIRARVYEAIGLVKCAVRRVQLFEPDWASRTEELIQRAQAVINDIAG